ncbi:MAG: polysaccharide deacetylase family protein [Opitutaceae bacterium]
MRPDRIITLGLVQPVRRWLDNLGNPTSGQDERVLPVLMYHSISDDPEPGGPAFFRLTTPPIRFALHMQWLADDGCVGVTLSQGLQWLAGRSTFSRRPIAITFDDGFRDFAVDAVPHLQHHGFLATMYLPTGFMEANSRGFRSRPCLSWEEARALQDAGMEFGSHTVNHPALYSLAWEEIAGELNASKDRMEDRLGCRVPHFAYPYAYPEGDRSFTRTFAALLRRSGYETSVTTSVGRVGQQHDVLALRRLPVNGCDDRRLLRAKLDGAYDWIAGPQIVYKTLRGALSLRPSVRSIKSIGQP